MKKQLLLWLVCFCFLSPSAQAHTASDSYLELVKTANGFTGKWDIALRDLDFALGLDTDLDGALTWGEIRTRARDIHEFAISALSLSRGDGVCAVSDSDLKIDTHSGDPYAALSFTLDCPENIGALSLSYDLMFDIDLSHRGLIHYQADNKETVAVASPNNRVLNLENTGSFDMLADFTGSGFDHILEGYDHILFLIVLIFSVILRAHPDIEVIRSVFYDTLKILTAFTAAHAVTLTIAQLGIVALPSRLVESVIALSIVLAAIDNFYNFLGSKKWLIAFFFGLIHGFGFASALGSISLSGSALALALVGFNVGIEAGQIVIAAATLIALYLVVNSLKLRRQVSYIGTGFAFLAGASWFIERAFTSL